MVTVSEDGGRAADGHAKLVTRVAWRTYTMDAAENVVKGLQTMSSEPRGCHDENRNQNDQVNEIMNPEARVYLQTKRISPVCI